MNAETAGHVGTPQLKQFLMVSIKEFPRGISDQVISLRAHDGECERAPGPGLKPQASSQTKTSLSSESLKHQATSVKS